MALKAKLAALAIILLLFCLAGLPAGVSLIPSELTGLYNSDDPRYEDRYLKLSESTIIFGKGGVELDVYFVSKVETELRGKETRYHITLHKSGEEDNETVLVRTGSDRVVWFKNRSSVRWVKQTDNGLRMGVELLSPNAIPYGARVLNASGVAQSNYMRVLLLPEIRSIGQAASLITPAVSFKAGQKVTLIQKGTESTILLNTLISSSGSSFQFAIQQTRRQRE